MSDLLLNEIRNGGGLYLSAAAKLFPSYRRGAAVNMATVWRWVLRGVRADDGRIVRLEAARLAGKWITTGPAIERFLAAQTPTIGEPTPSKTATPRQRERADAAARKQLEKAGIA